MVSKTRSTYSMPFSCSRVSQFRGSRGYIDIGKYLSQQAAFPPWLLMAHSWKGKVNVYLYVRYSHPPDVNLCLSKGVCREGHHG